VLGPHAPTFFIVGEIVLRAVCLLMRTAKDPELAPSVCDRDFHRSYPTSPFDPFFVKV